MSCQLRTANIDDIAARLTFSCVNGFGFTARTIPFDADVCRTGGCGAVAERPQTR